ncbi:MAG: BrnT family toxin [Roseimicrobium sp.]
MTERREAYEFEWDPKKAITNSKKHGVPFEGAATVFGDPLATPPGDLDHSVEEIRYILLGTSSEQRLLVITFAEWPPRTRLISARRDTRREWRQYEEEVWQREAAWRRRHDARGVRFLWWCARSSGCSLSEGQQCDRH